VVYTPQQGYSGPDSFQYQVQENGPYRLISYSPTLYANPTTTTSDPATVAITVTPTPPLTTPTITWPNLADITYGTALGGAQLDAPPSLRAPFPYPPAEGPALRAGSGQVLSVPSPPTDPPHSTPTTATAMININKAVPTITWANPADITAGTAL